jgi:hypothetical protein
VSKAGELEVKRARLVGRVGTLETAVNDERKRLNTGNDSLLSAAKVKELTKVAEGKDALGKLVQVLPNWRAVGAFAEQIYAIRPYSPHVPRAVVAYVDYLRQALAGGFAV